jgi:hypothetical protein
MAAFIRRPKKHGPKPKVPTAIHTQNIVDTALNMSTSHAGTVLFLPKAVDVARELELTQGQLYRGRSFVDKIQDATNFSFLHDGVVLSVGPAADQVSLSESASVGDSGSNPIGQIELIASQLSKDALALVIGSLAAQLASRED